MTDIRLWTGGELERFLQAYEAVLESSEVA